MSLSATKPGMNKMTVCRILSPEESSHYETLNVDCILVRNMILVSICVYDSVLVSTNKEEVLTVATVTAVLSPGYLCCMSR